MRSEISLHCNFQEFALKKEAKVNNRNVCILNINLCFKNTFFRGDVSYLPLVKVHGWAAQWVGGTELAMSGAAPHSEVTANPTTVRQSSQRTPTGQGGGGLQAEPSCLREIAQSR